MPSKSRDDSSCLHEAPTVADRADQPNDLPADKASGGAGAATRPVSNPSSTASFDGGRFTPGDVVDARYRVVSLVGRGGMGEVYRADDLKLGEVVALKFLPPRLSQDQRALARLHDEVRTARQISHRNVVRVHDIGEAEGQPFLSMEFVDGEDLASLIRRIGHLPQDKVKEIGIQLCAGLAAAHERGVLHRDLKPANIMIDGQGRAKISDFGLAVLSSEQAVDDHVGTPAYMAPEQLSRAQVSVASDLYGIGLILFEASTGQRAFRGASAQQYVERLDPDLQRLRSELGSIDESMKETIVGCLRAQPEDRFDTALEVAAGLRGGDALLFALDAGETPSPEMLARAPVRGRISKGLGLSGLLVALAGLVGGAWFTGRISLESIDGLPYQPAVLAHEAEEFLEQAGWPAGDSGGEVAREFWYEPTVVALSEYELVRTLDEWRERGDQWPALFEFVYRSGQDIKPSRWWNFAITSADPAPWTEGVATVRIDSRGRLLELRALSPANLSPANPATANSSELTQGPSSVAGNRVEAIGPGELEQESGPVARSTPLQSTGAPSGVEDVDWAPFFEASGLDPSLLARIDPALRPPLDVDRLWVWRGEFPDAARTPLTVAAASRDGRPLFWVVAPIEDDEKPFPRPPLEAAMLVFLTMLSVGSFIAFRNVRRGRGDLSGAGKIALVLLFSTLFLPLLARPTLLWSGFGLFFGLLARSLLLAAGGWVTYLALEPLLRRHLPRAQVSWSRLLQGKFRDPLVGRDILMGFVGATLYLVSVAGDWRTDLSTEGANLLFQHPHGSPALEGPMAVVGSAFHFILLLVPFGLMFLAMIPHALLRHPKMERVAAVLGVALIVGFSVLWDGFSPWSLVQGLLLGLLARRGGLLALVSMTVFLNGAGWLTLVDTDFDHWWTATSLITPIATAVIAVLAFHVATRASSSAIRRG